MNPQPEDYRTLCCHAIVKRLGRTNYICSACEEDVSMEFVVFMDAIDGGVVSERDNKRKKTKEEK